MSRPADPSAKIALLRAAEAAFAAHGLEGAKVDDIARAAGVSKGAFYLHFASKEEAFLHVVEGFLAACTRSFEGDEIPADARSPEAMLAFWHQRDVETYEFLWGHRATLGMLPSCQGEYAYLFESYRRAAYEAVVRWIDAATAREIFRPDLDRPIAAMILFGAYNELAVQLAASPRRPPIGRWVREAQRAFLRAFGTRRFQEAADRLPAEGDPPPPVRSLTEHLAGRRRGGDEQAPPIPAERPSRARRTEPTKPRRP